MRIPTTVRYLVRGAIIVLLTVGVAIGVLWDAPAGSAGETGEMTLVTADTTGYWTSLALDSSGNPVVSYYDSQDDDLRLLHCGNPNCSLGNSVTLPDTGGNVGEYTSLVLDSSGNPVVSYYDRTNGNLKILHCNDPDCAGGDESITSPAVLGVVGLYTSLELDASGNPVVAYVRTAGNILYLMVLRCNDPDCADDDESITEIDNFLRRSPSLALDSNDDPVVAYQKGGALKILKCGNPTCGPGALITSPDAGNVGVNPSLILDDDDYPVVSYAGRFDETFRVLRCTDPSCSSGNVINTVDTTCDSSCPFSSLVLDGNNPVVAYYQNVVGGPSSRLKVLRCNDPECAGEDDSITTPFDKSGNHGSALSLALDDSGHPIISYSGPGPELKILHCANPNCEDPPPPETPTVTLTATSSAADTATPTPAPATSTPVPATATPTNLPGDVGCDGTVNAIDAALVLQFSAGLVGSLACQQNADVNGDGRIDAIDASLILQFVAGLIPSL